MRLPRLPEIVALVVLTAPAAARADDPRLELEEANALKDGGACAEAVFRYEALAAGLAADHPVYGPARYNQAVCFEELRATDSALDLYRELAEGPGDPELRLDARFREGLILVELDRDREAARAFRRVARARKGSPDREIADLQLARLDLRAGRSAAAGRKLRKAAPVILEAAGRDPQALGWYAAQASLQLGDLFVAEAGRVPLAHSRARPLPRRLGEVAALMEGAEAHYVDAIRWGAPRWASASLLHLGDGYAALRLDFAALRDRLAAGSVRGMSAAAQRAAAAWLSERLDPIARKAWEAWSHCADLPRKVNRRDRSTDACDERLRDLPLEAMLEGAPYSSPK